MQLEQNDGVAAAIAVLHHHVFFCHMEPKAAYEDRLVGHDFLAVLGAFDLKETFQICAGAVAQLGQTVEHRALIRHTIRRRMTRQETIGGQGRSVRRREFRTRAGGNAMLLEVVGKQRRLLIRRAVRKQDFRPVDFAPVLIESFPFKLRRAR